MYTTSTLTYLCIFTFLSIYFNQATAQTPDPNFNVALSSSIDYASMVKQPDGKILAAGDFIHVNNVAKPGIMRFNVDGSLDQTFQAKLAPGVYVDVFALQPDGKIIIAGSLYLSGITDAYEVARLNPDGSLDQTFEVGSVSDFVISIAIQPDKKIILGGDFTLYNTIAANRIIRLHENGSIDNSFSTSAGTDERVSSIALQTDNKIVIGGQFNSFKGQEARKLARLNMDGTLDKTFNISIAFDESDYINTVLIQPEDNKILFAGSVNHANNNSFNGIVRLHPDGTLDDTFKNTEVITDYVDLMVLQPDNKILLSYERDIARLHADGTRDKSFNATIADDSYILNFILDHENKILLSANFSSNYRDSAGIIRLNTDGGQDKTYYVSLDWIGADYTGIQKQNDGKLILAGSFNKYNGVPVTNFVRLNKDGTLDSTFTSRAHASTQIGYPGLVALQPDGRILLTGYYTEPDGAQTHYFIRLNGDGSLDNTFSVDLGSFSSSIESMALQTDNKILITGYVNGKSMSRLNANGTLDNSFNLDFDFLPFGGTLIKLQPDGKILLSTDYEKELYRINTNGTQDQAFTTNTKNLFKEWNIRSIDLQSDGKIILGGEFTSLNGIITSGIIRLHKEGTLDSTFAANNGTGFSANTAIKAITLQADDKILVGTYLASFDGSPIKGIVRLKKDGGIDRTFDAQISVSGVSEIVIDTKSILIGGFVQTLDGKSLSIARLIFPPANPPTQLSATALSGSEIKLAWKDNSDEEAGFEIQRSATPGSGFTTVFTTEANSTSYTNVNLTATTTYYYRIKAVNAAGGSPFSNEVSATTTLLTQTITFNALPDKTYGDAPFLIKASASSGLAVSFSIVFGPAMVIADTLTITGAGQVTVRASQPGNATFLAATAIEQTFTVKKAQQVIDFAPLTDKSLGDAVFSLQATASSGLPVGFTLVIGQASISGNTFTITGIGQVTIEASQPGDNNFDSASPVEQSFCVLPAKPIITADANILTSNSSSGNQWLLNGVPIAGATGQAYTADTSGIYSVQVTGPCGTGVMSEPFELTITGIGEEEYELVRVFPNPAHEKLSVFLPEDLNVVRIQLLNSTGKTVNQIQNREKKQLHFNVDKLPKGMYILQIETVKSHIYKKVIIQ